jgi:hypothetical protein
MPVTSKGDSVSSKQQDVAVVIQDEQRHDSQMSKQRHTLLDQIHQFN